MKRLYIALFMVILCISGGIIEIYTINFSCEKCLAGINKIETEINKDNYEQAEAICLKIAEEYDKSIENSILGTNLDRNPESISQNFQVMAELLKNKEIVRYKEYREKTKKQLQTLKKGKLLNLKNIL